MKVIRIIRMTNPNKFPHALPDRELLRLVLIKASWTRPLEWYEKTAIAAMIVNGRRASVENYIRE